MSDPNVNPNFKSSALPGKYFDFENNPKYENDKKLFDSLITDAFNDYGISATYYITSYNTDHDKIFGEDNDRRVERKFPIMVSFELQKEAEIYNQFGIEGIDSFEMFSSQEHFRIASTVGVSGTTSGVGTFPEYEPRKGDILKTHFNNYWYEVVGVEEHDEQFLISQHSITFMVKPLKDEHLTVNPSLSGDEIADVIDQPDDIYSVSGAVDEEKDDILFNTSGDTQAPGLDPYGGW